MALTWAVSASLAVYPHSLSYFNELAGGPTRGSEHLVDSNIDWGQDLLWLRRWLQEHPEATPFGLVYFGGLDPEVAGIEYTLPPTGSGPGALTRGPQPGWYAVSVTMLRGYHYSVPNGVGGLQHLDGPAFAYFQRFEPVGRAGYSINIYHLTIEQANQARQELGLPLLSPAPAPAGPEPAS
jgi:hypothetical protein